MGCSHQQGIDLPLLVESVLQGLEIEVGIERQVLVRFEAKTACTIIGQHAFEYHPQGGDDIVGSAVAKERLAVDLALALQREQDRIADGRTEFAL